jgi:predicted metalloprotease with PDZ domain
VADGGLVVAAPTTIGTPLYEAGLDAGARLLRLDDAALSNPADLRAALEARRPGDRVRLTWVGRAGERSATVTLREDPNVEVVTFEDAGRTPSAAQLAFRAAWLDSRIR